MTNFPPPDYDDAVGAHLVPTAPTPPGAASPQSPPPPASPRTPPHRSPGKRLLGVLAALVLLLGPAIVGYQVGQGNDSASTANSAITQPSSNSPSLGTSGNGSSSGSSNGTGTSKSIDVAAIADKVDDSVININTALATGGAAAGTGIIISSQGLAITNNHVINDSTEIRAEVAATGKTYSATVLGYDIVDDVAVIQLENVSGLKAADIGSSSDLAIGDAVVALGNAGGVGGQPTVVSGAVTDLNQQITASESDGTNPQMLTDLIQVNANIQAGDSGGPLADADGAIVGMNAAASSRNGLGGFPSQSSTNEGYAIPIEKAIAIAKKIVAKESGVSIHIGANRARIGVGVDPTVATTRSGPFGGNGNGTGSGAVVSEVDGGSGADKAGITKGSTITAVNGKTVTSASTLSLEMVQYSPGDSVEVTWIDASGASHHATIQLGSGPPA